MAARKARIPVVVDTNVFVRNFKARRNTNANRRIIRLWLLEKRLQLILCPEIVEEYLGIFAEVLGMSDEQIEEWRQRFEEDSRCTMVSLGPRKSGSRDADDNVLLTTAAAGNAVALLSNDRDLLDIPDDVKETFRFVIQKPEEFLAELVQD